MKKSLILVFSVVLLFLPFSVNGLVCTLRADSCNAGEILIYKIEDVANSQAEISTEANYNNFWCCQTDSGIPDITCSGTNAVIRLSSDTNAHAEVISRTTDGYTDVCFADVKCEYSLLADCSDRGAEYTCVGSMETILNSHVAQCSDTDYAIKICCKDRCFGEEKGPCVADADCCSGYCSSGANEDLPGADWRCCSDGWYWNPDLFGPGAGGCEDADPCGISGTVSSGDRCYADIDVNLANWLADPDCHQTLPLPNEEGCCYVLLYGDDDYYFQDILVYT